MCIVAVGVNQLIQLVLRLVDRAQVVSRLTHLPIGSVGEGLIVPIIVICLHLALAYLLPTWLRGDFVTGW